MKLYFGAIKETGLRLIRAAETVFVCQALRGDLLIGELVEERTDMSFLPWDDGEASLAETLVDQAVLPECPEPAIPKRSKSVGGGKPHAGHPGKTEAQTEVDAKASAGVFKAVPHPAVRWEG